MKILIIKMPRYGEEEEKTGRETRRYRTRHLKRHVETIETKQHLLIGRKKKITIFETIEARENNIITFC